MLIWTLAEIDDTMRDVMEHVRVDERGTIHPDDLRVLTLAATAKHALRQLEKQAEIADGLRQVNNTALAYARDGYAYANQKRATDSMLSDWRNVITALEGGMMPREDGTVTIGGEILRLGTMPEMPGRSFDIASGKWVER